MIVMKKLFIHALTVFIAIVIAGPSLGRLDDEGMMATLKKRGIQHSTDRAILWVENGYLSKRGIKKVASRIDEGIIKSEEYLGVEFNREHYGDEKIHYFLKSGRFTSHVYGGYRQNLFRKPVVFLSFVQEKKSPYLHETVHILMWNFHSLWFREGLAIFLNDKLGGYPAFPNFGRDIDKSAKSLLDYKSKNVLKMIGQEGIPGFADQEEREVFYILSGSFVKFLEIHLGIKRLKELYEQENTREAFIKLTGKGIDEWKNEWINSL